MGSDPEDVKQIPLKIRSVPRRGAEIYAAACVIEPIHYINESASHQIGCHELPNTCLSKAWRDKLMCAKGPSHTGAGGLPARGLEVPRDSR